jgi:hypothetical protein
VAAAPPPAPLGDLPIWVDGAQQPVALVLTRTPTTGATWRVLAWTTDAAGHTLLPRAAFADEAGGSVPCLDLDLPTLGSCAMQLEPTLPAATTWLPPLGTLQLRVVEADGTPVHGDAVVTARVSQATPPADRVHGWHCVAGVATTPIEAIGLQLEVVATLPNGQTSEPTLVYGPEAAGEVRTVEVKLPVRPRFTARLLDPAGLPVADAVVELRFVDGDRSLGAACRSDAAGRIHFAGPPQATYSMRTTQVAARTVDGQLLVGRADHPLHAVASAALGDWTLEPAPRLAHGRCVDVLGQPRGGVTIVVQSKRPATTTPRRAGRFASEWRDLPGGRAVVADDGSFVVHGLDDGGALRLHVQEHPAVTVMVASRHDPVTVSLPRQRRRAGGGAAAAH